MRALILILISVFFQVSTEGKPLFSEPKKGSGVKNACTLAHTITSRMRDPKEERVFLSLMHSSVRLGDNPDRIYYGLSFAQLKAKEYDYSTEVFKIWGDYIESNCHLIANNNLISNAIIKSERVFVGEPSETNWIDPTEIISLVSKMAAYHQYVMRYGGFLGKADYGDTTFTPLRDLQSKISACVANADYKESPQAQHIQSFFEDVYSIEDMADRGTTLGEEAFGRAEDSIIDRIKKYKPIKYLGYLAEMLLADDKLAGVREELDTWAKFVGFDCGVKGCTEHDVVYNNPVVLFDAPNVSASDVCEAVQKDPNQERWQALFQSWLTLADLALESNDKSIVPEVTGFDWKLKAEIEFTETVE